MKEWKNGEGRQTARKTGKKISKEREKSMTERKPQRDAETEDKPYAK